MTHPPSGTPSDAWHMSCVSFCESAVGGPSSNTYRTHPLKHKLLFWQHCIRSKRVSRRISDATRVCARQACPKHLAFTVDDVQFCCTALISSIKTLRTGWLPAKAPDRVGARNAYKTSAIAWTSMETGGHVSFRGGVAIILLCFSGLAAGRPRHAAPGRRPLFRPMSSDAILCRSARVRSTPSTSLWQSALYF